MIRRETYTIYETEEEYEQLQDEFGYKAGDWIYFNVDDIWSDEAMENSYRTSGKKVFTKSTHTLAKTEYFYDWAATRLGVTREVAKRLTHLRLYDATPLQVAKEIALHSTIAEVRNACETYINDLQIRST